MATIFGTSGNDALTGTSGADTIYGQAGDDTLIGGLGNDTLQGGLGNDTYIFNRGDGQDTIFDNGAGSGEVNTLQFGTGISVSQVTVKESGTGDLVLSITGTTDKITLRNQLMSAAGGVDQVVFADGTVWNRAALLALATAPTSGNDTFYGDYNANTLNGAAGNDALSGGAGDDTLIGGAGNDTLSGGVGNDTYVFNLGDGQDTITDNGAASGETNTLQLGSGILPATVVVTEVNGGADLVLAISGTTDRITLKNQLVSATGGVDQVVFADGTVWTRAALLAQATAPTGGNDTFYGDYLGNTLNGGAGNDTLYGAGGDDVLAGGTGSDVLVGGAGNDSYLFNLGDGQDTILDNGTSNSSEVNTLRLGAGIAVGAVSVTEVNGGRDLLLSIAGTTDSVLLQNQLIAKTGGVDQVVFADGTVWSRADLLSQATLPTPANATLYGDYADNVLTGGTGNDTIYGAAGNDTLAGAGGNDYLEGGVGNDTYLFGRGGGSDRINDNGAAADIDRLQFAADIAPADIVVAQANGGQDIVLSIAGGSDSVVLGNQLVGTTGGVDLVQFADGTVWDRATLLAKSLLGTSGDDVLGGDDTANTLAGGAGNDRLIGRGGADTYIYSLGDGVDVIDDQASSDGDTVLLHGIVPSQVHVVRSGDNALLLFEADHSSRLTLAGQFAGTGTIEQVVFDDGTVWSSSDTLAAAIGGTDNVTLGTNAAETIVGSGINDTLEGLRGNDVLQGGGGDDTYIFNADDGQDTIIEAGGTDTLAFGRGLAASDAFLQAVGNDLYVRFRSSTDSVLIQSALAAFSAMVKNVHFADGTNWNLTKPLTFTYIGTDTNTVLTGSSYGTNIFELGPGGDTVTAGSANDVVIFNRGIGHATVTLTGTGATLKLAAGIAQSEVTVQTAVNGDVAVVLAGTSDSVTFLGAGAKGLNTISFADGAVWRLISGTSGNDTLNGGSGVDFINGGLGADQLNGGAGSDTFFYKGGDGNDTITESGAADGSVDKLILIDIMPSRVSLTRNGNDVTLVIAPSTQGGSDGGSVLLKAELDNLNGQGVESIIFADGTVWSPSILRTMLISIAGTAGNDTLTGTSGSEIIAGGLGDDTIDGGGGSDTYLYNAGDGNDGITDSSVFDGATDQLVLGAGLTPSALVISRNGTDIILSFTNQPGSVRLVAEDGGVGTGIEQVVFGDGTIWSKQQLENAYIAQQMAAGATSITGFDQNNDVIIGTSGNDTLSGLGGNDTLTGGAGNDTLDGGSGSDTYIYNAGDGNDTITDNTAFDGSNDRLVLGAGLTPANLVISRSGSDVTLSFSDQAGSIRMVAFDSGANVGLEQVVFGDGTVWSKQQLESAYIAQQMAAGATSITGFDQNNDVIIGTSGNDTLSSLGGNDTLTGGAGNDTLDGGSGSDTYIYNAGDGNDTITDNTAFDGSNDRLVLGAGLTPANLVISRSGSDVTLSFSDQAGSIRMVAFDSGANVGLEQVAFGDGTVWSKQQLESAYIAQQMAAGATSITGFDQNNDVIIGTSGNDTLSSLGGNDTLTGGAGNDTLDGGSGSDTYIYNAGDGNDTITDNTAFDGSNDRLVLGAGLTPANLVIGRSGGDVTLSFSDQAGSIRMVAFDGGSSSVGLEQVVLGDGTVWSKQQLESAYIAQQMAAGATSITGFDQNNDVIVGTSGNDTLSGLGGNDTLTGGAGNDALDGGSGSDTYIYNAGDGNDTITDNTAFDGSNDRLVLGAGLTPANLVIGRSGGDVTLSFSDQAGSIRMVAFDGGSSSVGLEQVVLGDGTVWSKQQLESAYIAQQMAAGATSITGFDQNNDVIGGTSGNDTLYGLGGNDTLKGGAGNDYLNGGSGADTYIYTSAGGNDVIEDSTNDNVLVMQDIASTAVILSRPGNGADLVIENTLTGKTITVKGQFSSGNLASVTFNDGVTWTASAIGGIIASQPVILGTDAADTITGTANAEIIDGRGGNDALNGGSGADTYLFRAGSGNDVIQEVVANTGNDVVELVGLTAADVDITRSGNDLLLRILSSGETLTIKDQFLGAGTVVELLQFGASGSVVDLRNNAAPTVTITSAAETSNVAVQTITGTVTSGGIAKVAGQTVTLTDNGVPLGTATVQADGSFAATVTLPNQGSNAIVASVTDSFGSTGSSASVVDFLYSLAPTVAITGVSHNGYGATQTIAGTVVSGGAATVVGRSVTLTDNGVTVGTATVQANGTFSASVALQRLSGNAIVATVADSYGNVGTSPAIVDSYAGVLPKITGTITGQMTTSEASVHPFSTVTIEDLNVGATDTLTITLSGAGGILSGTGLSGSNGVYTLSGSASTITGQLRALTFAPAEGVPNTSGTTTFTLSDSSTGYVAPAYGGITVLASFNGNNGQSPAGGLVMDSGGNLFGTTSYGYAIFELAKSGSGWSSPTPLAGIGSASSLFVDAAGNIFGSGLGGANNAGIVYELVKNGSGWNSSVTTLVSFNNATSGSYPSSPTMDADGNLLGTAMLGGSGGRGTVYEIVKTANGYSSTPTVLASFNISNGVQPFGQLIFDSAGNLFGATATTVFEIPKSGGSYGAMIVLSSSISPAGGLIMDSDGNLYGVDAAGGNGNGAIYKLAKTSNGYSNTPIVLASFSSAGLFPSGPLVMDAAGNLYGTTGTGSISGHGAIFKIVKSGSGYDSAPVFMSTFTGLNGLYPSQLIMDAAGNLFGGTQGGGQYGQGAIFKLGVNSSSAVAAAAVDAATTVIDTRPALTSAVTVASTAQAANISAQTSSEGGNADGVNLAAILGSIGEASAGIDTDRQIAQLVQAMATYSTAESSFLASPMLASINNDAGLQNALAVAL
ncbi:putative calcium binding hemolysin protein [Bradyrhizobium oligotrophicum S58]|uniref:Putative calcium binding hemolysin protein n=3 Tax=Bradyrhizobium oligotrophicum TaxID=44255 RepID=M4ZDZ3_9BRAD|nr:calcium-binding protein [Bradyrhizobium oligotrophicum]BAM91984.1 putative calcium binding hemolysin protein [Bradyrhizobium oligotrophicum S58]